MRRKLVGLAGPGKMVLLAVLLAGCRSTQAPAPVVEAAVPSIAPDALVGRWGLASYHNEADRERTQVAARAQCNKPYVIGKGQNGGVMMHLADQKELQELFIKTGSDGRSFIGPAGDPAGGAADSEILSFGDGLLRTRWVDPDTASRYGTMVYARCKGA